MLSTMAESSTETQIWLNDEIARLSVRLAQVKSAADTYALLRSLVRLHGGRLDREWVHSRCAELNPEAATRFGLAIGSTAIRFLDERQEQAPEGFWAAQDLDISLRRQRENLPPDAILLRYTDHPDYRSEGQKAAVRSLVTMPKGASLMVCLPTGSGKSLLFQLTAARMRDESRGSCVVVITPTVSLALDHERTLSQMPGLEASRALVGGMNPIDRASLIDAFRRGEIPVLFMSPEVALGSVREYLIEAATSPTKKLETLGAQISAVFIDEAHIIESWGRSFRPDFQRLPGLVHELRSHNSDLQCVLLSATLPPSAREVLRASYKSDRGWGEVDAATPRREFDIVVQRYRDADARLQALDFVIDRAPRPLIVYTTLAGDEGADRGPSDLRLSAGELFVHLKSRGYERIALFSGEISSTSERSQIVRDWADDKIDIVVATSAFGMGVDKANVRSVVHACLPDSPARYYQEIGRAARDGRQGLAVCLFTDADKDGVKDDVSHARSTATSSWITKDLATPRWDAMLHAGSNSRWTGDRRAMTIDLDAMRHGITLSTDFNRRWNMSILNLLQRARMLDVISCSHEPDRFTWDVEIREPSLLAPGVDEVWDRVFSLRDNEQARARTEVRHFIDIMRRPQNVCVLREVFELLQERYTDEISSCGRCPGCRARGEMYVAEPLQRFSADIWPAGPLATPLKLPPGTTLIIPEDVTFSKDLAQIIGRLSSSGVEQVVVPDDIALDCAVALKFSDARLGLVINHSSIVANDTGIAQIPTAILLRSNDDVSTRVLGIINRLKDRGALPEPLLIVTSPSMELDGRRLDQTLSLRAPYLEDSLGHFSIMDFVA